MTKTCTKCDIEKSMGDFYPSRRRVCKSCVSAEHIQYYANNREKMREQQNERRRKDAALQHAAGTRSIYQPKGSWTSEYKKEYHRRKNLEHQYGLAYEDYESMLLDQDGSCAICGNPPGKRSLAVDHDHKTGRIRGLLCGRCNIGIGSLGDDVSRVFAAAAYLLEYEDILQGNLA